MRPIPTLLAAAILAAASTGTPAQAVIFEYFEGNNCTQKKLGASDVGNLRNEVLGWNMKRVGEDLRRVALVFVPFIAPIMTNTYNDEIRSLRVTSNWRTLREQRSAVIAVYDDPNGKTNDDWAKLYVSDATLIPDEGVCIGSFERAFSGYGMRLERHPNNGLDGKISHIKFFCDAACRGNLTPDPTPVATATQPLAPAKPKFVPSSPRAGAPLSKEARDALKRR